MDSTPLGGTGLRVSELGLGTAMWASDTDAQEAADLLRDFVEAGGSLLATAASHAEGACEELIGGLLDAVVPRSEVVIATKGGVRQTARGPEPDASRGHLIGELDGSLRRLGTDHVDVFVVHAPDPHTPVEETVSALSAVVAAGKARYVGLANHPAWVTAQVATLLADDVGLACVEVEYSLLQRGIEREVVPAARTLGLGVLAWSPLGRGVLTGKYRRAVPSDSRAASAHLAAFVEPYLTSEYTGIVEAVATAAEGLGREPLEVALAWLRTRPALGSAIIGPRTAGQLHAALASLDLELPEEIVTALDEVSAPTAATPFSSPR